MTDDCVSTAGVDVDVCRIFEKIDNSPLLLSFRKTMLLKSAISSTRTTRHGIFKRRADYFKLCCSRSVHVEKRLEELGITLPAAPGPKANYNIVCHASGNMMYISGHLPVRPDGSMMTGRIAPSGSSEGQSLEHGYEAARHAGLNIVSTLKSQLGDLDRVKQIVKVFGIVQSTNDFKEQHKVMDGCSDLMMEVFGQPVGYHARSAIGTSTLPLDISVEVEAIVEIKE